MSFTRSGYPKWKLVDPSPQKNERRKWVHLFDYFTAIIFVVDLSLVDVSRDVDG